MKMSEKIDALAKALCEVQGELVFAKKDSTNPFFKSTYADLGANLEAYQPLLTKHGLCVSQLMGSSPEGATVTTMLMHVSGQWICGELPTCAKTRDPQGQGSAITYARRYSYQGIVMGAAEDDDAESAMQRPREQAQKPALKAVAKTSGAPKMTTAEVNGLAQGEYRIPFGKMRGKTFSEIDPEVLDNYCTWIKDKAAEDGKEITGQTAEFLQRANEHLAQV